MFGDFDHARGGIAGEDRNAELRKEKSILAGAAVQLENMIAKTKGSLERAPHDIALRSADQRLREGRVVGVRHAVEGGRGFMRRERRCWHHYSVAPTVACKLSRVA